jgi:ABC-type Fe3+ transport system permease subunit
MPKEYTSDISDSHNPSCRLTGFAVAGSFVADELVVVVDTRTMNFDMMKYLADLYNSNIVLFSVWAMVLTILVGCVLGFLMHVVIARTMESSDIREVIEL